MKSDLAKFEGAAITLLLVGCLGLSGCSKSPQNESAAKAAAGFTQTGPVGTKRSRHSAILLQGGMVLIAGGRADMKATGNCALFDPANNAWIPTDDLVTARYGHASTMLKNGKVLVMGGRGNGEGDLASAEVYDPEKKLWFEVSPLNKARKGGHSATLLANGKVLVVGSGDPFPDSRRYGRDAEIYDPDSNTWSITPRPPFSPSNHSATLLGDGRVLIAGGLFGNPQRNAQIYDPITNTWSETGSLNTARAYHTATLLSNGKVLVLGGEGHISTDLALSGGMYAPVLSSAELFDPATGKWTATTALGAKRYLHTATLLKNGDVLVAGGEPPTLDSELYDTNHEIWRVAGKMMVERDEHTATLMTDGSVLFAGGESGRIEMLPSAETYNP